jgi:hypothetical protein
MEIQIEKTAVENRTASRKKFPQIPDFLIIGAGKSGTTSLDNYLKQHPGLFIPSFKEPNFYGYENIKPMDFKNDPEELNHYKLSVTNLPDYLKLFQNAKPGQLIGETSNTYMYHQDAPARIKHYNPDVKLIAVLRQPAARLYSRYLHLARENRTPTTDFAECLNKDTIWWRRNDLVREGFYYRNLSKFYQMFPKENIRVFLYDDFNSKPNDVLREIFQFLDVDTDFQTDFSVRYNESGFIKNRFWDKVYGQHGILVKTAKALFPQKLHESLKGNIFFQKQLNNLRSQNLSKPKLDPELQFRLNNEVYGDDIRNLEKLIGRDLSRWLAKPRESRTDK